MKPMKPTVKPELALVQEDSSEANIVTVLLSSIIVILLTVILNTNYSGHKTQNKMVYQQKQVTKVIVKEREPLINLSNNEKAALFLIIPSGVILYFIFTGIGAGARAGKQKIDSFGRKYI